MLRKYQDPASVDKIMRIEASLADTRDVLHQTIDQVLERGVKLDDLVAKSDGELTITGGRVAGGACSVVLAVAHAYPPPLPTADLSTQSRLFYTQAKKTNSCTS